MGKLGGNSNILPEMIKAACCQKDFMTLLLDLVHTVWRQRRVPRDWSDAILIPIPKKGDLSRCDNWCGIALLEVVGKVVAWIIQDRLQQMAEGELPESQCGFRKGRGCSDMLFVLRQLMEKSVEHRTKQFTIFVDLKKAYDSVPRAALWRALQKVRVQYGIVESVRSFHEGMKARICIDGEPLYRGSDQCGQWPKAGLHYGPIPLQLVYVSGGGEWKERMRHVDGAGMCLRYKLDGKLFRRSIRGAESVRLSECQFADDTAILASTRQGAEDAIMAYIDVADKFGLTVNLLKTKLLVMGCGLTEEDMAPIVVGGDMIERWMSSHILVLLLCPVLGLMQKLTDAWLVLAGPLELYAMLFLMTSTSPSQQSVRCTSHAYCLSSCMGVNA